MMFELYPSCLVVDEDENVVDAVEDGPGILVCRTEQSASHHPRGMV